MRKYFAISGKACTLALVASAGLSLAPAASASKVMLEPTAVSSNMGQVTSVHPLTATIDQSGLVNSYTSGVTDLDTYMAGTADHASSAGGFIGWLSGAGITSGHIDFDLGADYSISAMAYWAYAVNLNTSIKDFSLSAGLLADFSDAVSLGSFTASQPTSYTTFPNFAGEVFNFSATNARYVRMNVANIYGGTITTLGEVAFAGGAMPPPVPEPSTALMLGIGAAGLLASRRKKA